MRAGRGVLITGVLLVVFGIVLAAGGFVVGREGYTTATTGGAMEPTYPEGDRVPVERIGADEVRHGDVVLYKTPGRYGGMAVLQRVIGLGGDRVAFADGALTVNGVRLHEPYVKGDDFGMDTRPYDVKVPAGRMFLLGDNRGNSNDSRYFLSESDGTVPTSAVVGRALDSAVVMVLLGLTMVLGVLLALGGAVCVLVGWTTRRRRRAAAATPFAQYV